MWLCFLTLLYIAARVFGIDLLIVLLFLFCSASFLCFLRLQWVLSSRGATVQNTVNYAFTACVTWLCTSHRPLYLEPMWNSPVKPHLVSTSAYQHRRALTHPGVTSCDRDGLLDRGGGGGMWLRTMTPSGWSSVCERRWSHTSCDRGERGAVSFRAVTLAWSVPATFQALWNIHWQMFKDAKRTRPLPTLLCFRWHLLTSLPSSCSIFAGFLGSHFVASFSENIFDVTFFYVCLCGCSVILSKEKKLKQRETCCLDHMSHSVWERPQKEASAFVYAGGLEDLGI